MPHFLSWTLYFIGRWFNESQSTHHKDTCLQEIALCLQILITTLHPIVNTNWEDLCIQLINQQTCASIIVYDMNGVPISIQFSNKLYQRFANATQILLCNSNRNKLEIMKNEPNNTHIPYGQIQYVVLGQGQY